MARVKDPWSLWQKSLFLCLSGKWRLIGVLYRRRWYWWCLYIYIYVYTFIKYILSWAIAMYLELAPRLWSFASTLSTAKRCFQKRCRKIGDWNESNVVIGVLVTETLVLTNRPRQIITPHWCRCMPQWKVWNCANWWDFLMGGPGVFKKSWTVFVDMIACHL